MENAIVILILLAIAAGSLWYLIRAKKRGETCIGCPSAKQCGGKCNGGCSEKPTRSPSLSENKKR